MPEGLDAGTVWGLAQKAADAGLGFQTTWDALRTGGHPMTQDNFRSVWGQATQLNAARSSIAAGGDNYIPTGRDIVDAPINFAQNFATRVQIEGNILGTNDTKTIIVTHLSNEPMVNADAITSAVADVLLDPTNYGIQPTGAAVLQVERSADVANRLTF